MAYKTVKASNLVENFKQMLDEKWQYVPGAARKGEVDCSGAFAYWYGKAGSYMPHGSNSMWRKYTIEKGKIGEVQLLPGMAVYKRREWDTDNVGNTYFGDSIGDFYHVGCYIGNNEVIEAKGQKYGVVKTKLSDWAYAGKLMYTDYDTNQVLNKQEQSGDYPWDGVVHVNSGFLNLRTGAGTDYAAKARAYDGDSIVVKGKTGDWYCVEFKKQTLYAKMDYILPADSIAEDVSWKVSVIVESTEDKNKLVSYIRTLGYQASACETGD